MTNDFRDMRAMAAQIVDALGSEFTLVPAREDDGSERWPSIRHTSGYEFWLSGASWNKPGTVGVHATWPEIPGYNKNGRWVSAQRFAPYFSEYSRYGKSAPSINFSATKPAKQQAADIVRRFLPAFVPLWMEMKADMDRHLEFNANEKRLATEVAAVIKGTVQTKDDGRAYVNVPHTEHGISDVKLGSQTVTVTLSGLSVDDLRRVAAVVDSLQEA